LRQLLEARAPRKRFRASSSRGESGERAEFEPRPARKGSDSCGRGERRRASDSRGSASGHAFMGKLHRPLVLASTSFVLAFSVRARAGETTRDARAATTPILFVENRGQ